MPEERQPGSLTPRQQELLALLDGRSFVRISELAAALAVNPMTIRRDLKWLDALGLVQRLHGGCRLTQRGTFDRAFAQRAYMYAQAKESIGERAAALVEPGQVVLVDTGTTALAIARALAARAPSGITVVTPSLPVLWELYNAPHIRVTALGGDLQRETGRLYGPITESILTSFIADLAFVGADGIDVERGFVADTPEAARTVAAMWRAARQCIVVADSSKVGRRAPFVYAGLAGARLITDRLTPAQREQLQGTGLIWEEAEDDDQGQPPEPAPPF